MKFFTSFSQTAYNYYKQPLKIANSICLSNILTIKSKVTTFILSLITLLSISNKNFAQAPNFGSAANFVFFTASGAVGNTGVSTITGNIGTNLGAVTNFGAPSTLTGNSYMANNVTAQAATDLTNAYTQLNIIPVTNLTHGLTFGNGEVLTAGVYAIAGAVSVSGILTLDAQGDATKLFIIKTGGAFTTAASTTINLVNGASACNVFWIAEGAIAMAASTIMKGTLIAHNAANSLAAGSSLEGRMYSTGGAVTIDNVVAAVSVGCTVPSLCANNPVITSQPLSANICKGQSTTFSVVATGANLSYQWSKGGRDIAGATSPSYYIASSTVSDTGSYYVMIIGSCSPFVTSTTVKLVVNTPGISLGTVNNVVLFTSSSSIANTGVSQLTGDIGINTGTIAGFATATINGTVHNADSVTALWVTDLQNVYNQLNSTLPTNTTHSPAFGLGETITSGVYATGGAASVGGILNLDAQGDATRVFIFKIGGAFTTGANATINLINGASACNVYWVVEGAVSTGASTFMKGTLVAHNAAISLGTGTILEGRMLSTGGAVAIDQVSISKPTGCIENGLWTGTVSSDWYTVCNWYYGLIPTPTTNVTIPSGLVNYPVLNTGIAYAANISIQNNASFSVTGAQLKINGSITNAGTFNNLGGTIELNGLAPQYIPANTFANNTMVNFVINNNVSITGALNVTGALSFGSSNNTLTTNGFLTLKSTATATARLADITHLISDTTIAFVGNKIVGNVTVERYFPARRAWRLVTAPLTGAGSIFSTWQNSGVFETSKGAFVTGPGAAITNGLDVSPRNNSSLFMGSNYTPVSNTLTTQLSANTNNLNNKADNNAFFIFVRGDRTASNYSAGYSNTTTLSSKGKLQTGNIQFSFLPTDGLYNLVGNPYASPVDFSKIIRTNLNDVFYAWDPYLNLEQGGYITMLGNPYDLTADYLQTPFSPGGQTKIIQSSQAFFVVKIDPAAPASLNFSEAAKSIDVSVLGNGTFRPMNVLEMLRTNLYVVNADGTTVLADGNLVQFDNRYDGAFDKMDAIKFSNTLETLGILVGSTSLSVDRRPSLNAPDTIFFKFTKSRQLKYQFEFIPTNLNPLLQPVLQDSYTGVSTPLSSTNTSTVNFLVDGNAASQLATRFRIVYTTAKVLPVTYTLVKAYQQAKDITVEWTVENELNITNYEVEKSTDGINFVKANATKATAVNGANASYTWEDVNTKPGTEFYRIKNNNLNGSFQYSKVVKVVIGSMAENISVYPNPVVNGVIGLQLSNQPAGKYEIKLTNNLGQAILSNKITHAGGTALQTIVAQQKLTSGTYQLEVTKPNNTKTTINVAVQ